MDRRKRTFIVLAIAVVLASAASFIVYRAITRMPVREVEVATVHVAVAAEDLPTGTLILKEHVKVVGWPAASPLQGSFASPEDVLNRGLIQSVAMNEPITEAKLAPIEAGAGLPPAITPGMRALSIRVNEVIGVAGFTLPGTRVDVLVTLQEAANTLTRVVLSNIQVLTAGTMYDTERGRQGNAMPATVVTLLVTPEDAERLTLAQSAGAITLVLRNPLDVAPTDTKGARLPNLFGPPAPPPVMKTIGGQRRAVAVTPVVAAPPPAQVETYRAGKKSVQTIDNGGEGSKGGDGDKEER
jgi:pilus assembly protein CpaB